MSLENTTANNGGVERTASLPDPTSFTVCMWLYCVTDNNTGQHFYNYDNGGDQGIEAQVNTGANTIDIWDGRNTITAFSSNPSPITGQWIFFAQRSNGTNALQSRWATIDSPTFATHNSSGTGAWGGTLTDMTFCHGIFAEAFDGRIAHPKVWDAELTDNELYLEMYSVLPVRLTNLNFALRVISGSSVTDIGPNGRNGTINNSPVVAEDPIWATDNMWCPQFGQHVLTAPAAPGLRWLLANSGRILVGNPGRYLRAA